MVWIVFLTTLVLPDGSDDVRFKEQPCEVQNQGWIHLARAVYKQHWLDLWQIQYHQHTEELSLFPGPEETTMKETKTTKSQKSRLRLQFSELLGVDFHSLVFGIVIECVCIHIYI